MLWQRVATALVLLPLLLAAVWWLPTAQLYALFAALGLVMAWEWTQLMALRAIAARLAFVAVTAAVLLAVWLLREHWLWIAALALLWWAWALRLIVGYPVQFERNRPGVTQMSLIGLLLIPPAILCVAQLHAMPDGRLRLLYLFFLIFAADTGAYFAGRRFGKRKLAPAVSPGKTLEGLFGGMTLCAVWALVAGPYAFAGKPLLPLALLSMGVAALSVVGDLAESLFKRAAGVKDSGKILPGHGGILDRVDSLLAAAPAMALGLGLLGY